MRRILVLDTFASENARQKLWKKPYRRSNEAKVRRESMNGINESNRWIDSSIRSPQGFARDGHTMSPQPPSVRILCWGMFLFYFLNIKHQVIKHRFLFFLGVLEGFRSSGRLVGFISAYPDASPTPCCRVMAKNPSGDAFPVYGIILHPNQQLHDLRN